MNLFYFIYFFSNTIVADFNAITANIMSLFYLMIRHCFYDMTFVHFWKKIIVCVIPTIVSIKLCFLFQTYDLEPILFVDTAYCRRPSSKWQQEIIICFVCCITAVIWLRSYTVLNNIFYIINGLLKQNLYWFCLYNSKRG